MKAIDVDLQQFQARTGRAEFTCLLSPRSSPCKLSLTSRGANPRFFLFDVSERGYFIRDYPGDRYKDLLDVLRTDGRSGERLVPADWLRQLDGAVPEQARHAPVSPREIAALDPDMEEHRRLHFDTWIRWETGRPSEKNLRKTRLMLGDEAWEHSKSHDMSSRWSEKPTNRDWRRADG